MSFKVVSTITAVIAFLVGTGYILFGSVVISRWEIVPTDAVLLLGRRMGSLYVGLSVIFLLSRSAPLSIERTALNIGAVITLSLLALFGIYEFFSDNAGSGILVSAVVEILLVIGFIIVLFSDMKTKTP